MKRINYILDKNNIIIDWTRIPFDENKPFIELDDNVEIHCGFDKIIDGNFIADIESYTNAHLVEQEKAIKTLRIYELKTLLANSDYQALKHADGALTDEEYEPMRIQRQLWRDEINELENN